MKTLRIVIKGKVQGIFFRANTKKAADKLSITGYVKNLSNGDVEILAQGEEKSLKKFLEFCKKGPENAKVESIETKEINLNKTNNFGIKYD